MPDIPDLPETVPAPAPHATPDTPTEVPAAAPAATPPPESGVADTARLLASHFPALFGAGVIKPIKLRIQVDIQQRAPGVFSKKALSMFLQRYTTTTAYLRGLVAEGAARSDLDGQPAGEIAAEHRDAAGSELERRRAIVDAKKLAGREAARASRQEARPPQPPRSPSPPRQPAASRPGSQAPAERDGAGGDRSAQSHAAGRPDRAPRSPRPDPAPGRTPGVPSDTPRGAGRTANTGPGAARGAHKPMPERNRAGDRERGPMAPPAPPMTQEEAAEREARHQRALLLRSFEQSPLSKANFGALKGLGEAALDALLAQARQERG